MATRQNLVPPNLVIAPKQYEARYQDQLNNVQRLFYSQVANTINAPYVYGSYYSNIRQTITAANTPTNVLLDDGAGYNTGLQAATKTSTYYPNNVPTSYSRVYVSETALYNVQFSAQCDETHNGAVIFTFWLRQNGKDIPATAGQVTTPGQGINSNPAMAAWNYVIPLQANDYIELMWEADDSSAHLEYTVARTTSPPRPSIPSVILTIVWASSLNTSVGIS